MQFEDLSLYRYGSPDWQSLRTLNVGWLGGTFDFPTTDPFPPFLDKLAAFCRKPINLMRGFHVCELCGFDPMHGRTDFDGFLGNGEVRVAHSDGTMFAAPVMIYHYVRDHRYRPPAAFLEAVMRHCDACLGKLEAKVEGQVQGLFYPPFKRWDVVATHLPLAFKKSS